MLWKLIQIYLGNQVNEEEKVDSMRKEERGKEKCEEEEAGYTERS